MTAPVVPPSQALFPLGDLAIMAAFLVVGLAFWIFPRYSYEVSDDTLKVRRLRSY